MTNNIEKTLQITEKVNPTTKKVRNRSGHRVELVINGKVVVFYPGKITEVPANFDVPRGLGLYVR